MAEWALYSTPDPEYQAAAAKLFGSSQAEKKSSVASPNVGPHPQAGGQSFLTSFTTPSVANVRDGSKLDEADFGNS